MAARTEFHKVLDEYVAAPGEIRVIAVLDGLLHEWHGGRIAPVANDPRARKLVSRGPWHVEWLCKDARNGVWYVRRGALKNPWYEG